MTAIARAARTLSAAIDEGEFLDGRVGRLIDLVSRSLERIALDVERANSSPNPVEPE
jgi:hypothetical protein